MDKQKKNTILSITTILLASIFTILVKFIDVKPIGPNNSEVGFASLNKFVFDLTGKIDLWIHISDILVILSILIALFFGGLGIYELIKRKNIKKVDKEIIWLGIFYCLVVLIYIIFNKVVINYRPILVDGILEPSFPSSHTLMATFFCGSAIIVNNRLFKGDWVKKLNIAIFIIMILTPITRLISGVHWTTDIIGGVLFTVALLTLFKTCLDKIRKKEK